MDNIVLDPMAALNLMLKCYQSATKFIKLCLLNVETRYYHVNLSICLRRYIKMKCRKYYFIKEGLNKKYFGRKSLLKTGRNGKNLLKLTLDFGLNLSWKVSFFAYSAKEGFS